MPTETEQIDNPVIKDDEMGAQLRELSQQVDSGAIEGDDATLPPAETVAPEPEEKPAEPDKTDKPRDEHGKFVKAPTVEPVKPAPDAVDASKTAPESEYAAGQRQKQEKEQARLDKAFELTTRDWKTVNERKEAIDRAERENSERETRLQQARQPKLQLPKMDDGSPMTSSALFRARDDFASNAHEARAQARKALNEGDYDAFGRFDDVVNKQSELASLANADGQRVHSIEQELAHEEFVEKFNGQWLGQMQSAMANNAELRDKTSELSGRVLKLLAIKDPDGMNPYEKRPNGFAEAAWHAGLELKAEASDAYKARAEKAEAALTERDKASSLAGGGITSPPRAKTFDQMTPDEQSRILRDSALTHDSGN